MTQKVVVYDDMIQVLDENYKTMVEETQQPQAE